MLELVEVVERVMKVDVGGSLEYYKYELKWVDVGLV